MAGAGRASVFARYLMTGGGLVVIDASVFALSVSWFGLHPSTSQFLARLSGAVAGFFGHKYFSFRHERQSARRKAVTQGGAYAAVVVLMLIVSPLIVSGLYSWFHSALWAKVVAEPMLVVITFVLLRWVFAPGGRSRD